MCLDRHSAKNSGSKFVSDLAHVLKRVANVFACFKLVRVCGPISTWKHQALLCAWSSDVRSSDLLSWAAPRCFALCVVF